MIRFECDYAEGAHPLILERFIATNEEQTPGYGMDEHCERARKLIKDKCEHEDIDVHFLVGGTQTNMTVIASALRSYQGVIAAESGHINGHETGAIEATGHKVLTIPSTDGKIHAEQVEQICVAHKEDSSREHVVQPAMVYLSFPTETGMIYSKEELYAIKKVAKEHGIYVFIDGARLGYGLVSCENDVTLKDITECSDVFYIGGTKVGALFGEAIVIRNDVLKKDFRYHMKQRGGLLAKGRLLGIQFETLFEEDLYMEISKKAVEYAMQVKDAFRKKGVSFLYDSTTNQQFPILSHEALEQLGKKYSFTDWCKISEHTSAVRFCTSWATKEENVKQLLEDIAML
ncbi:threonine aldolase family protein [Anaerosporobacter faecicola]|uniref:threonine aldolase family protein n=1 Tax=Anaerosporobacter faecicola TaxID=2718714 RepID=UPI00143BE2A2|nr:beta-eliminating lyase-related protein [Anaerosporobacter faecicola]